MNVHLIRSREVSKELYRDVIELLQSYGGPVNYISSEDVTKYDEEELQNKTIKTEDDFSSMEMQSAPPGFMGFRSFPMEQKVFSWEQLFKKCNDYRRRNDVRNKEFVILLTDIANDKNWFSYIDESKMNGFIHTDDWDYYISTDPKYPIAYQVVELLLLSHTITEHSELSNIVHEKPVGCMFDFTGNKKDVTLKLRTADICPKCQGLIKDRRVPKGLVNQVLLTIEGIRKQMLFKERFKYHLQPSRIVFNLRRKELIFSDIENLKLHLNPLQATLFYFFLVHKRGVHINKLDKYEDELYRIYSKCSNQGSLASMKNSIDELVDTASGSFLQKKSRLNKKLKEALGADLAEHYKIDRIGRDYPFKIKIDRELVTLKGNDGL
jgi:hypothetical protein